MLLANTQLFNICNNWMYHNMNCVNWDMLEYCYINGHYSYNDIIDDDGNLLDSIKVITVYDLQNACDEVGIDIDCINF